MMLATKLQEAAANSTLPTYIEDVFSTYLYTGNDSAQTISNGIDLSTKGGLVWGKKRGAAGDHYFTDTVRGNTAVLKSNSTAAQVTNETVISGFNSNGFGITDIFSDSGVTYASWTFRKQPKFFDVVTYTGNGTNGRTVAHSLGSTPGCIIVKRTDASNGWAVYHRAMNASPQDYMMRLNATDGAFTTSPSRWNNTLPTSTEFTLSGNDEVNGSGATYVAYLFAHNAGGFGLTGTDNVISCGSFTTDGSGYGSVTLGYEPQWILMKDTQSSTIYDNWYVIDNMRGFLANGNANELYANKSDAENANVQRAAPTATGFIPQGLNASKTYIYIAIRRGPMKVPTSGTSVFSVESYNQTSASDPAFNLGKVADAGLRRVSDFEDSWRFQSRLTGNGGLITSSTAAESTMNYGKWDNNVGWYQGAAITPPYSQANWYGWTFARAPSFFDEVCYTGTGSVTTFSHNLGVVPELMIVRRRSAGGAWMVNSQYLAADARLELQSTSAVKAPPEYGDVWNNTRPTSTVFTVSTDSDVNASGGTYVNYLFATCAGVSKVGSYTGTGTTLQINCGFTGGARFVLIKRTDSTGDWYVWDSARGIVSGNDPYLLLNSTAAEVTNTDYVDTYSAGFEISSTAPAAINASGGTFIFLAIA